MSVIFNLLTYAIDTPTYNCVKQGYLTAVLGWLYADPQGHLEVWYWFWVKIQTSRWARDVSCPVQSCKHLGGSRTSLFTCPGMCRSLAYTWLEAPDQSGTEDSARHFCPRTANTQTRWICLESSYLEIKYALSNQETSLGGCASEPLGTMTFACAF